MSTPDGTGHAGPGLLESKYTLNIVAGDLLTRHRVDDNGLNTEEWQGSTAGLGGSDTTQGGDDVGASLGLPVGLYMYKRLDLIKNLQRMGGGK